MISNEVNQQELEKLIEQAKIIIEEQKGKNFTILLAGRTGVGKSSTINSLMDKVVAEVGGFEPETVTIKKYRHEINGIPFTIVDSSCLCDDLEEIGNDYDYINLMMEKIDRLDSMWFVARLDDTRVTSHEKRGIKMISQAFGEKIWEQAIIVFTFAGKVPLEKYSTTVAGRTRQIRWEIGRYAGADIAENVPSVAVDNLQDTTPDGKIWLNKLFTNTYTRMLKEGALPFIFSLLDRLEPPKPEPEVIYQDRVVSPQPSAYTPSEPSYHESSDKKIHLDKGNMIEVSKTTIEIFEECYEKGRTEGKKNFGNFIGNIVGGTKSGVEGGSQTNIGRFAGGVIGFLRECRDALTGR